MSLTRSVLIEAEAEQLENSIELGDTIDREVDAVVHERLRAAAAFLLATTVGVTLVELVGFGLAPGMAQLSTRAVIAIAAWALLVATSSAKYSPPPIPAAMLLVGITQVSLAAAGVLRGDTSVNASLGVVLTLTAAALFPWGWERQMFVVFNAVFAVYWNVFLVGKHPAMVFSLSDLAVGTVAFSTSLFVAQQLGSWLERSIQSAYRVRRGQIERERLLAKISAANAELERFVYTVSHDLKGPLITLRGFSGLLSSDLDAGDEDRARESAGHIDRAAQEMGELLNGLLALSRAGRVADPTAKVFLGDLAAEVVTTLAGPIAEAEATVEIQPGLPLVLADSLRLSEVLQNLIENALKFRNPERPAKIQIGAEAGPDGEPWFFVRDNGIGIDSQNQDKIFNLFERLSPEFPGSGIGLALVKRIVDVHGGRVWLTSDGPEQGTTFYFTCASPRARAAASEDKGGTT